MSNLRFLITGATGATGGAAAAQLLEKDSRSAPSFIARTTGPKTSESEGQRS